MKHITFCLASLFFLALPVQAQPTPASLRAELLHSEAMAGPADAFDASLRQRSIPLAFAFSAILPGAGQAYNRQWVKAVVLVTIEAALITGYSTWRSQGLQGERDFQAFAHAEWDPAKYGAWLNDYKAFQVDNGLANITAPDVIIPTGIDFSRPDTWSASERRAVNDYFSQIRAIERQSVDAVTRATFSHVLPFFGEQQYYELVGKYFQFAPGWVDYPAWRNGDGTFNAAINPEQADATGAKVHVSDTFYRYAGDHAEANDLLRRASRLSTLFILNHLIAAAEAAITTKKRNDRIQTSMGFTYGPDGQAQPVASLSVRF